MLPEARTPIALDKLERREAAASGQQRWQLVCCDVDWHSIGELGADHDHVHGAVVTKYFEHPLCIELFEANFACSNVKV